MVAVSKIKYFAERVRAIKRDKEIEINKTFAHLPVKQIEIVAAGGGVMRSDAAIREVAKSLVGTCNPKFGVLDIYNLDGEITDNSAANQKLSDAKDVAMADLHKLATKALDTVHFGTDDQLQAMILELEAWKATV